MARHSSRSRLSQALWRNAWTLTSSARFRNHPRSAGDTVIDSWREYLDHSSTKQDEQALWNARGDELFTNLLFAISQDVGFTFDRVQLKKGVYSPAAHGDLELEQLLLRRAAIRALAGETALKMKIVDLPGAAVPAKPELPQQASAPVAGET